MTFNFPDVNLDNFNPNGDWLIQAMNDDTLAVSYAGQGINQGLRLNMDYQSNPEVYQTLTVGELVKLPRDLLESSDGTNQSIDDVF